ncbi:MAG: HEPN domain-containing protein [Ruminococcus sp.]|jgi:HEPN domain-containing protein|nr:HEPN domain-containing protein [Ruminococcus sp.]
MKDHTSVWLKMADESLIDAKALIKSNRFLFTGYACNLAVEKALKANYSAVTGEIPPRTHDLIKLAKTGNVYDSFSSEQIEFIDKITPLQIEGRYTEYKEEVNSTLNKKTCQKLIKDTEAFICFLKTKLDR